MDITLSLPKGGKRSTDRDFHWRVDPAGAPDAALWLGQFRLRINSSIAVNRSTMN